MRSTRAAALFVALALAVMPATMQVPTAWAADAEPPGPTATSTPAPSPTGNGARTVAPADESTAATSSPRSGESVTPGATGSASTASPASTGSSASSASQSPSGTASTSAPASPTTPAGPSKPAAATESPSPSASRAGTGPTIASDLPDYAPGGTVTLTGSGWQPGEVVTIVVNDTGGLSWSLNQDVVADADGRITLTFALPDRYVPDYDVTATGPISGVATTTFTDAASGGWQNWLSTPAPPNNGNVSPGGTITYTLNAQKTGVTPTGVTGAVMTLTLTGDATFTGPTGSLGTDLGSISGIGTKTLTWTGMTLDRTTGTGAVNVTRTITVTATVPAAATAGTVTAAAGDANDPNGNLAAGALGATSHTVTGPTAGTCSFATPGSGDFSRSICWFDLAGYNATTAASAAGQNMQQTLLNGYVLSYTIKATGTGTGSTNVAAVSLPTYSAAFLGNTGSTYSNNYQGIAGKPAVYQQTAGTTTTLTLTNISLKDSSGTVVTGFALVGADAESSDNSESITWTSDKLITSIGALGNSCGGGFSGAGTTTVKCAGNSVGNKSGAAILYSQDPGTFAQTMVGGGLQAVAFGVMVSGLQLNKQTVNKQAGDQFGISVTRSDNTVLGSATTDANGSATTNQLYVISSAAQSFTMSEVPLGSTDPTNYAVSWACTRNGKAFDPTSPSGSGNTVTLTFGDFIVCTITNTGPALTLRKSVDKTAGGTLTPANWTLSATRSGSAPSISEAATQSSSTSGNITTASTTKVAVPAGSYTLAESSTAAGADRYAASGWTCTNVGTGTFTLVGNVLTLTAGATVTCTVTNTYLRGVIVRKTWVNGVSGDKADLVINGATAAPGKATSTSDGSPGSWTDPATVATATPTPGSRVTVAETMPGSNKGRYTSTLRCVDATNQPVPITNGGFAMPGSNVTCTFANEGIRPTIALWKTTLDAAGGPFSFELTNTVQGTGTVTTASGGTRTQVDGDATTAGVQPFTAAAFNTAVTISEAGSLPSGWLFTTASCSNGTTAVGSFVGTTYTIPASELIAGATITCDYTNRPATGGITWSKVDAGSASTLLAGSEWTLTGPSFPTGTPVTDCVALSAALCVGLDKNPAAGGFTLTGVRSGSYTLVETKAPAGFRLDATPRTLSIAADGDIADVGAIRNRRVPVPAVPLTGGPGADSFLISGAVLLALAAAAAWRQRRRLIQHPRP
jgi:hypothetical protein